MSAALDLAIVGAGVAGTAVAYRLSRLRPEWSVAVFEASGRVGGRLLSLRPPGIDGVRAELGGMRFRTSQPNVSGLVGELGLDVRPFRTVDDDNAYLLRGSRLVASDFRDPSRVPYQPSQRFAGLSPGELLFGALEAVVPGAARMTAEEWAIAKRERRYEGRPLYEWALGSLLRRIVGEDGYRLIADGFGYQSVFADRNAADAIPWLLIEARPEEENHTLVDGMESLPRELTSRFVAAGGRVHLRHRLVNLEREDARGSGRYRLRFDSQGDVTARRIVLAMPPTALGRAAGILDDSAIRGAAGTVTAHPAAKLCLCFDEPWWREAGRSTLRSVSDLALQKVYYFDRSVPASASKAPALLLVYTDGTAREAWRALTDRRIVPDDDQQYDSGERWGQYEATPAAVDRAHELLSRLHGRTEVPRPYSSAFMDWGWDPFRGAYSLWDAGVRSWEVIPRMIQPLPGEQVYVCGESWSESQGWVEGALETAGMVIQRLANA